MSKERHQYYDDYDRETIQKGRIIKNSKELEIFKYHRWKEKESFIQARINEHTRKGQLAADAKAPSGISCMMCGRMMNPTCLAVIENRVLFSYTCLLGHLPKRLLYNDGREILPDTGCQKCGSKNLQTEHTETNNILTVTDTCNSCGYVAELILPISDEVEQINEKDRSQYCFTDQEAEKSEPAFWEEVGKDIEHLAEILKEADRQKESDELDEAIKKIQRLTVPQIEELMREAVTKAGYTKFEIGAIETQGRIKVSFTFQDPSDRNEKNSRSLIQTALEDVLQPTHWRLSGGLMYRLGILSEKIEVHETDEDLRQLLQKES